jgi:hypothetical protein
MTALRIRGARAWHALALALVLLGAAAGPAGGQVNMQLSGTIESIEGQTLTLLTPAPPRRPTIGAPAAPPPRPTLVVNLDDVPASQYVFLRPGDRIAVVGLLAADGRHFTAVSIVGGARAPREPQAP